MRIQAKDVIGIGVHIVDCQAHDKIIKEPMTFYVVRCSLCRSRGTYDSLMNKHDMIETTRQVWDEMIRNSWLTYGSKSLPPTEFIKDREEQSLDRFFTFKRYLSTPESPDEQEKE
jgi:hypothetical protein